MEWPLAVLLGILQGLTEWLPVSSEGLTTLALTITGEPLGSAVGFAIWLHVGTLGSAIVYLRGDLVDVLGAVRDAEDPARPVLVFLVVATLATGLIGAPLLVYGLGSIAFAPWLGTLLIGVLLLVTAAVLAASDPGLRAMEGADTGDAIPAGLVQGIAAMPGLSRSGLTTAILFARGLSAPAALRLSFLMSIPAVAGAQVALALTDPVAMGPPAIGAAVAAFVVGLASMDGLLRLAENVRFEYVVLVLGLVAIAAAGVMFVV